MTVTFILKNLSDVFYNGGGVLGTVGLLTLDDKGKWERLKDCATRKELPITMKVGHDGSFRNHVELNQILRNPNTRFYFKIEPRRGYKLATFDIVEPLNHHSSKS